MIRTLLLSAVLLVGCGPQNPVVTPPVDDKAHDHHHNEHTEAADAKLVRLRSGVQPVIYNIELKIDPRAETFSGTTTIDLDVGEETDAILLHARELTFSVADMLLANDKQLKGEVTHPHEDLVEIVFPEVIAPGQHRLTLTYTAPLPEALKGLYRVEVEGEWYAFTQFEPISARAVFPCFDEPAVKVPFNISMVTPSDHVAVTNTPEVRTDAAEDGFTRHVFAQSEPMPTYLVAFAVGPFDVVEAPEGAIPNVPFRILTTQGKGDRIQYAMERTPPILAALADYFGEPYPYAKLDFVAVPNFGAGAMENVGLVTYRETLLMVDEDSPPSQKRSSQSVIAHELAHMWFGNLVSPAWWDELWLNEAFATWMAGKAMDVAAPELEPRLGMIRWVSWVMSSDSKKDARAIRQPINEVGDVYNAFDGITYGKGAGVLRMIETWIGEEEFKMGVRNYLAKHRWGAATTDDLLAELEAASGKPVSRVLTNFVDQPGVPLVNVTMSCTGTNVLVDLEQSRYLPADSKADQGDPWVVPVCMHFGLSDGSSREECVLLEQSEQRFEFESATCPVFVHPNAGARGYYRWNTNRANLESLLTEYMSRLLLEERVAFDSLLVGLLQAELIDIELYMRGLSYLAAQEHRSIIQGVVGALYFLHGDIVPVELRETAFAAWVQSLLEPHRAHLGLVPRDPEPVSDRMLRPTVVSALTKLGRAPDLVASAEKATDAFLTDRKSIPLDVANQSLPFVAETGDAALWDRLRSQLDDPAIEPHERSLVILALGQFHDPALLKKSLGLFLDGTLLGQDLGTLTSGVGDALTADVVWTWMTENYDAIGAIIGEERLSGMPRFGRGFCDAAGLEKVTTFFSDPAHLVSGSERKLGLTLEGIEQCIQLRARTADGARKFLSEAVPKAAAAE